MTKKLSLSIVLAAFLTGAAAAPVWTAPLLQLFGRISDSQEVEIGRAAAEHVEKEKRLVTSGSVNRYVDQLGRRLARHSNRPDLQYHFKVIDEQEANAFALPGGFIYVNRGIIRLAENESELAGVLAHEIAHVSERHGLEQVQRAQRIGLGLGLLDLFLGDQRGTAEGLAGIGATLFAQGLYLKYSRNAEREADREGVTMLRRAGINPHGMVTLFQRMDSLRGNQPRLVGDFFSSHPSPGERRQNISDLLSPGDSRLATDNRNFQRIRRELGGKPNSR